MVFQESQRLNLWWLYILLGLESIVILCLISFGKDALSHAQLREMYYMPFLAILLPFLLIFLITRNRFELKIDESGISYHYWPFTRRKRLSWTQINRAYLRKYDALGEYGGWGVKHRLWFKMNDKAYIFNDRNVGLQLELNNRKKLLFSSEKSEELNLFLINLKNTFPISAIETDVRER